jgi:putative cardiolipin synthase
LLAPSLKVGVLLAIACLVSGCGSLPAIGERPYELSSPADPASPLARAVELAPTEPQESGFRLLPSGPMALSARLTLAQEATRSLDLQYFMVRADRTGLEVMRSLRDAARRGVRVRLLVDDLYAPSDEVLLALAAHENVEVRLFNPFPLRQPGMGARFLASVFDFEQLNHRMHNKLFIADGTLAITGGRNIADEYYSRRQSANFVDLDILASGEVVGAMSSEFDQYWNSRLAYPVQLVAAKPPQSRVELARRFDELVGGVVAPDRALPYETDFLGRPSLEADLAKGTVPLIRSHGESQADSPDKGVRSDGRRVTGRYGASPVRLSAVALMRSAQKEVILTSPYFVPGEAGIELVRSLTQRGVVVRILTNSLASTDQPLVHGAYRRYRRALLEAGVDLYELSPKWVGNEKQRKAFGLSAGGLHTKSLVIDRSIVVIGSMNFDPRSDHYNTESAVVVHSPELSREVAQLARISSLEGAHRLTLVDGDQIRWIDPSTDDSAPHRTEPEASLWLRFWLRVLSVFAPESLL